MKIIVPLLLLLTFFQTGCVNKHGISLKYYSDCKEYYDLQGFYHKECGDDDIVTYKQMRNAFKEKTKEPKSNVW
ncbi:MAG: hypothetical protein FAF05_03230 [Epsilonproteobacteria bacterium]|nr:hypothetical protein [Campylobacterota bacterium]